MGLFLSRHQSSFLFMFADEIQSKPQWKLKQKKKIKNKNNWLSIELTTRKCSNQFVWSYSNHTHYTPDFIVGATHQQRGKQILFGIWHKWCLNIYSGNNWKQFSVQKMRCKQTYARSAYRLNELLPYVCINLILSFRCCCCCFFLKAEIMSARTRSPARLPTVCLVCSSIPGRNESCN